MNGQSSSAVKDSVSEQGEIRGRAVSFVPQNLVRRLSGSQRQGEGEEGM